MKKLLTILLTVLLVFTIAGCEKEPVDTYEDYLEIYYLNDFHGALEEESDQIGIAKIANLINTRKEQAPDNVLFITGGDILQGSALSNYYNGLSTINLLNLMNLDAFTIGNHEFDWGLDVIANYADGNPDNGEADFPFLGANIFYKDTEDRPEFIDPYVIVEKGNHKVGIIGTMGYGLEYAIAASKVKDYEFASPVEWIEYYAEKLRVIEGCDIVIVSAHDGGGSLNNQLLMLEGDKKIDAIFNGHTHSTYAEVNNGVPVVQSSDNGEYVGYVKFDFTGEEVVVKADNLDSYSSEYLNGEDPEVLALLNEYIDETSTLLGGEIIVSGDDYSKGDLSWWLTDLMRQASGADVVFHNYGGTRNDIDNNQSISLATLYQIWPFDNVIKTVLLPGSVVGPLVENGGMAVSTEITSFDDNTLYRVATNDYVFDKSNYPFLDGEDIIYTGIVVRDLVEDELLLQANEYSSFLVSNTLLTDPVDYVITE